MLQNIADKVFSTKDIERFIQLCTRYIMAEDTFKVSLLLYFGGKIPIPYLKLQFLQCVQPSQCVSGRRLWSFKCGLDYLRQSYNLCALLHWCGQLYDYRFHQNSNPLDLKSSFIMVFCTFWQIFSVGKSKWRSKIIQESIQIPQFMWKLQTRNFFETERLKASKPSECWLEPALRTWRFQFRQKPPVL